MDYVGHWTDDVGWMMLDGCWIDIGCMSDGCWMDGWMLDGWMLDVGCMFDG